MFTLLTTERIAEILQEHVKAPEKRVAQRVLAEEVVTLVHQAHTAQKCVFQTAALYPAQSSTSDTKRTSYKSDLILHAFRGDAVMLQQLPLLSVLGIPLSRVLKMIGLASTYGTSPRWLEQLTLGRRRFESRAKWRSLCQWCSEKGDRYCRRPEPVPG
jgi:tyrosyl-tRNA synthetase